MNNVAAMLHASRPSFLVLAPLCIMLGMVLAITQGAGPAGHELALVMVAGLLAHASVNWLNEYDDYRSGLDFATARTPFSGGSGSLPLVPSAAVWVLAAGVLSLAGVVLIGVYFIWVRGAALLYPGLLGIALVVAYTRWLTRSPVLCLLAPGLGFGPVMVAGSVMALGGRLDAATLCASLVAWLLTSELLLVNQFPDVEADARHGRRHLPIQIGRPRAARRALALLLGSHAVVALAVLAGWFPGWAALALLPLPLAVWLGRGLLADSEKPSRLPFWMGINVATLLGTLALLSLGLIIGGGQPAGPADAPGL